MHISSVPVFELVGYAWRMLVHWRRPLLMDAGTILALAGTALLALSLLHLLQSSAPESMMRGFVLLQLVLKLLPVPFLVRWVRVFSQPDPESAMRDLQTRPLAMRSTEWRIVLLLVGMVMLIAVASWVLLLVSHTPGELQGMLTPGASAGQPLTLDAQGVTGLIRSMMLASLLMLPILFRLAMLIPVLANEHTQPFRHLDALCRGRWVALMVLIGLGWLVPILVSEKLLEWLVLQMISQAGWPGTRGLIAGMADLGWDLVEAASFAAVAGSSYRWLQAGRS